MSKANLVAATLAAVMPLALLVYQAEPNTRDYGAEPAATGRQIWSDLAEVAKE